MRLAIGLKDKADIIADLERRRRRFNRRRNLKVTWFTKLNGRPFKQDWE